MTVYAVALSKGGSTKTTTAAELVAALARRGRRVLAIDLDQQGNLSRRMGLTDSTEVSAVAADSRAARAGLRGGDQVTLARAERISAGSRAGFPAGVRQAITTSARNSTVPSRTTFWHSAMRAEPISTTRDCTTSASSKRAGDR